MDEREQAILGSLFSAEEREEWEVHEREHRVRVAPETIHVNCETGEMISRSGQIDDDTIAEWERKHAASVARYRARFGERPPPANPVA